MQAKVSGFFHMPPRSNVIVLTTLLRLRTEPPERSKNRTNGGFPVGVTTITVKGQGFTESSASTDLPWIGEG